MWGRDIPGEGTASTLVQRSEAAQEAGPCNQSLWLESDEMSWEERGQTLESLMASWQVLQMSIECCSVH